MQDNKILNKPDNSVELSIDAFEALAYNLKRIDLFTYSQLLINYFMMQDNKILSKPKERKSYTPPKRDVFSKDSMIVQGNVKRNSDLFDGLGKK